PRPHLFTYTTLFRSNFKALMAEGDFRPLQTSMPPQSPVAWSTFMTGMDPGGHGIYDFIHVDYDKLMPYSSMAKADPGGRPINIRSEEHTSELQSPYD